MTFEELTPEEESSRLRLLAALAPSILDAVAARLEVEAVLLHKRLEAASRSTSSVAEPADASGPAVLRGDFLTLGDRDIALTANQRCIAKAFADRTVKRMSSEEIVSAAGVPSPRMTLKRLVQKHPILAAVVTFPGKRCRGGYGFNVIEEETQ